MGGMVNALTLQENQRKINKGLGDEKPASHKAGSCYRYLIIFSVLGQDDSFRNALVCGRGGEVGFLRVYRMQTSVEQGACSRSPREPRV